MFCEVVMLQDLITTARQKKLIEGQANTTVTKQDDTTNQYVVVVTLFTLGF